MGDRANVFVKDHGDEGTGVFLYTHWSGYILPETVLSALVRGRDRWDDGPYLSRIVFCEMVKGDEMNTSGYGISARCGDGYNRIICLDPDGERIGFVKSPEAVSVRPWTNETDFAEFVERGTHNVTWP